MGLDHYEAFSPTPETQIPALLYLTGASLGPTFITTPDGENYRLLALALQGEPVGSDETHTFIGMMADPGALVNDLVLKLLSTVLSKEDTFEVMDDIHKRAESDKMPWFSERLREDGIIDGPAPRHDKKESDVRE